MPMFTQPGDRAIDGLVAGLGQLFAFVGWATVAVGMSAVPSMAPPILLAPMVGCVAGMLASRAFVGTLVLEVVMLAASAALAPTAQAWVWLGAGVLGIGRLAGFIQRRRSGG
jgi:hypothetical protein